jgi:DnaJ domain
MTKNKTHYQVLGVDFNASHAELKKAYKRLARVYHPDLNPKRKITATDRFQRLQEAYDVLSDPSTRQQYDQSMGYAQPDWEPSPQPKSHQPTPQTYPVDYDTYESGSWTVHVPSDQSTWKAKFREVNWRKKLAVLVWAVCLLGSLLPTSYSVVLSWNTFYEISFWQRLVWITIPLVLVWVGIWMADESDDLASLGSAVKEGVGRLLEVFAWVYFARLVGLMFIGPLVLLFS